MTSFALGACRGDHRADWRDGIRVDQLLRHRVLRLADAYSLLDFVSKDAGADVKRGLYLLLALGVGALAGEMRSGPDMLGEQGSC